MASRAFVCVCVCGKGLHSEASRYGTPSVGMGIVAVVIVFVVAAFVVVIWAPRVYTTRPSLASS